MCHRAVVAFLINGQMDQKGFLFSSTFMPFKQEYMVSSADILLDFISFAHVHFVIHNSVDQTTHNFNVVMFVCLWQQICDTFYIKEGMSGPFSLPDRTFCHYVHCFICSSNQPTNKVARYLGLDVLRQTQGGRESKRLRDFKCIYLMLLFILQNKYINFKISDISDVYSTLEPTDRVGDSKGAVVEREALQVRRSTSSVPL